MRKLTLRLVFNVFIIVVSMFIIVARATASVINTSASKESNYHYELLAQVTSQEITTWFSNEAQIVMNQKASIEINNDYSREYLTAYLTRIVNEYNDEGYIYDLYFVNTKNEMFSGYGYVPDASIDFRQRPWYANCLNQNALYYSTPYKDTNLDKFVVTISSAVYNQNQELQGVLALDIFVDTLFRIVEKQDTPENSYVFLLDSELGIATHPSDAFHYVNEQPLLLSDTSDEIYQELTNQLKNSTPKLAAFTDYDGVKRVLYVSRIECCNWYVVVAISEAVVQHSKKAMLTSVLAALLVSLVVGIVTTLIAAREIVEKLSAATEAANAANETKSSFLANMSHEIRTPINAVIGMNEMILRENHEPHIQEYALDIASASRGLISIINDILDFSKIESGKLELIINEFNIASVANDIIHMALSRMGEKPLKLLADIDPTIPAGILGDENRIKQIILNLVTNGIKYTNNGYVLLRLYYSRQAYGINLNISVEDSGIGITEENIEKLFHSFQQVDTKRNRMVEGTGLGLAITKQLVSSMGGFIHVSSTYGAGSVFHVVLPLKISNDTPFLSISKPTAVHARYLPDFQRNSSTMEKFFQVVHSASEQMDIDLLICINLQALKNETAEKRITHIFVEQQQYLENEAYFCSIADSIVVTVIRQRNTVCSMPENIRCISEPFSALSAACIISNQTQLLHWDNRKHLTFRFIAPEAKILVVDDNQVNLKVAVGLLKPYQMQIQTAGSGAEAIALMEQQRDFTLVFMDHMMPVMDGVETVSLLRAKPDPYFKNVPIIALTANTTNEARILSAQVGFHDFLPKPIDVSMLERILCKYIPGALQQPMEQTAEMTAPPSKESSGKFDPQQGLIYMGGDETLYHEILSEYLRSGEHVQKELEALYQAEDLPNYTIKVHALKSTSMSIGASELSALARELETAGKAGDFSVIQAHHREVCAQHLEILSAIRAYLQEQNSDTADTAAAAACRSLSEEEMASWIAEFTAACEAFDCDTAETLLHTAEQAEFQGCPLLSFAKETAALINDFDYDEAIQKARSLYPHLSGKEQTE
ncbi:MAG: ATP-binding protein [Oscillospiraceae bacterium]|nr:ATP-binding protein [Oscillospiraceae bacterium]